MTPQPQPQFQPVWAPPPPNGSEGRSGWIYRVFASGPKARVLAIGSDRVAPWFEGEVASASKLPPVSGMDSKFDLVVLHATLGGCASTEAAFRAAARATNPGGIVALSGANSLSPFRSHTDAPIGQPTATRQGYRRAALRAGLNEVATYIVRPDLVDPVWLVDASPVSSTPFLAFEAAAARASGRWTRAWMRSAIVRIGGGLLLAPWLLTVGRSC